MGTVAYLRPNNPGDAAAGDLHDWCVELEGRLCGTHPTATTVDDATPCDHATASAALGGTCDVVFFFGHGDVDRLDGTHGASAVDKANIGRARGKSIVAVACLAGRGLAADAVNAGVDAFLGWNTKLLWEAPPAGTVGPFGSAIVDGLEILGSGARVEQVKDRLRTALDAVAEFYRVGAGASSPNAQLAYYGAACAAGQIALCGNEKAAPL